MTRLIVGLGNPGKKYAETRHNIGFLIVQAFAALQGMTFTENKRFHAAVASGVIAQEKVILLLPMTYMNESGRALRKVVDYYQLDPTKEALVVYDDVAFPFGVLRLRTTGSSGGHNGLKSLQAHLSTQDYSRLRCGIGEHSHGGDRSDHVLGVFTAAEKKTIRDDLIPKATDILLRWLREDVSQLMNEVNQRKNEKSPKENSGEMNG